jgi:hypothetical protein
MDFASGRFVQRSESPPPTQAAPTVNRTFPAVRLLLYYVVLSAIGVLVASVVPDLAPTTQIPISKNEAEDLMRAGVTSMPEASSWRAVVGRGINALIAMSWALAMTLPVAWTLKHTRKFRYDPSLVQTLVILPIVVAGIVLVVKNSLALAFSLAGIVAGVRFRQKLDEPEQAVYVLLALGIGLAAGVHSLDVALVMSMAFTFIVLTFWRYDIGDIYAGGRGAQLAMGDERMLQSRRDSDEVDPKLVEGMKPSGMLVVSTTDPDEARRGIEVVLGRMAKHWRIGEPVAPRGWGPSRLEIPVELKDKCDPSELIAELESRMGTQLSAAEYVPFGNRGDLG